MANQATLNADIKTQELEFLLGARSRIVDLAEIYRNRFYAVTNRHLAGAKVEPGAEKLWAQLLCDVGAHLPCRMAQARKPRPTHRAARDRRERK